MYDSVSSPSRAPYDAPPSSPSSTEGPFGHRNPDPGPAYRATFTEEVKATIVAAARTTYRLVQEGYDEALGFNPQTFGHCIYHVGTFQLDKAFKRSGGSLARVEELRSLIRFQGGEYTVAFYKVGSSALTSIWEAFPTSDNGTMSVNGERQPILLGLEEAMMDRVEGSRYVVIAHLGNPTTGLGAVYLCIPIEAEGGKVKRWGYAECLYLAAAGGSLLEPEELASPPPEIRIPAVELPQEEPEGDVVVRAKSS